METSPVRGGGTDAAPATSPNRGNPLAPFAAAESSPRRSKRQLAKKGADDKGMKQLDLRQMQQRSPTKAARAAASAVGNAAGAEQQPIVIRDDVDPKATRTAVKKKKTLRAARNGDDEAMPACASSDQVRTVLGGQGDGGAVEAPSGTLGEEKEDLRQTPVAAETTAAAGATAVAGMAGWIMRPGARKAAAAAEAPKAPRKTRARPARDAAKGEVAAAAAQPAQLPAAVADGAAAVDPNNAGSGAAPVPKKQRSRRNVKKALDASESVPAPSQATSATVESTSAMPDPTAEQPPEETATSASTGGETSNARGRGRGKARQPRRAKATRNDEAEEETSSDLTTPTSSQDDEQQSSPSQRRSGRLQVKRDAALDKIREQEALLRTAALEQQRQQQLRDAEQSPARGGGSGSEGSEGHSSPGEQGWMWKSSAAAGRTRTKRGGSKAEGEEVRLASVKPRRRLPIAALPFTTDLPEAPAGQEKLMLRLKVPPGLQLEMRSLGESKTQSAPASPAGGSRLRATKRSKRKRAGGSDDSGGEDGSYSANEATRSTTAGNDNEPRRKRRRRVDAEKDLPQPTASAKPRGRKKAKDEVPEVEPQPVVGGGGGEEFFMTKEQREAHRQARMKEKLKKRTEESKKVDLKLTHGKEAHPFLMPRKAPVSTSSSSGTSSSSSSSLSTSSFVAFLPLPPPVPSHVTQLTAREEAFLASFGPATSALFPPVGMHSTHSDAPAGPLFEGMRGMDQLRARTIRAAEEQRTKSDEVRVLASAGGLETEPCVDDAAMVVQVLDAIHALFPSTATTDHGHERAVEAQHLLAAYRWKHDNAGGTGGMTSSSESAAACRQLWTEKYRPRCARDVIDHGPGMATLAGWLARWKKSATTKTTKTKKTSRRRAKSDEDDGTVCKANLLLLQGRAGIGKTAAVYACAEEYGFRVLEINPSVERTGAHIKNLVEEATQSRNVASLSSASAVAPAGGDSISPSPPTSQGEAARCSLVLFEEVDVVFATDKGFFSALRELLRIAKTPVVLTCNAVTDEVADLLRDVSPHIDLRFGPVRHAELLLHLQLVCLAEGLRCADVVAQTNDVKQLVEHVGGDVRRSLLALQFWLQNGGGGGGGFDYLSWLGPGDVAAHGGHDSLASLLLAGTTDERLRWAAQAPMSMTSLLHCNLFSFFPRVGAQPELAPAAPACLFVDSGMVSTTTTTTTTTTTPSAEAAPAQSAVAAVSRDRALALVPMMDGLEFLCDVLSFNDAASTERRKRKTLVHHGMDITPDAMLGREVEAATAVLGLACLPAAFAEEHVEELAIPHKHNKQLTLREAHRAGYEAVYGEVVPRVQHVSRYGGIDCFGMVQHIAQLDALNHQAKEGRRKRRHVNCLGLEAGQHAWLMRHAFPLVPPSLVDPIHQRDRLRAQAAGEGADDDIQPPPTPANDAIQDQDDEEALGEEGGKCEEGEQDDGVDGMEPSSSQGEEEEGEVRGEEATEEPSQSPSPSQSQSQEGVREEECSSQFVSMEDEVAAYEDEDESERESESETKEGGEEKQDSSADVL